MKKTRKYIQYPTYNDPKFNIKITNHPDFVDTKYIANLANIRSVEEKATEQIEDHVFEIASYQLFIKTFLSLNTPYNSMLLYHGLGTGKTCSAIGTSEDIRNYYKQFNIDGKIYIIASPNVQDNFRLQLFNETKLISINGEWNINGCVGKSIINEINPLHIKNYPRDKLIQHIKSIINKYYVFLGYTKLAKLINTLIEKDPINYLDLQKMFNDNLVIIDEYHNMRTEIDMESLKSKKNTTEQLDNLVEHTQNMRLLLLSATPLYNNYKEIIWTLNLLRKNDKRSKITSSDIFTLAGFTANGREKLLEYSRGYISFVKGDNPFIFPYKLYPPMYPNYYKQIIESDDFPTIQLNGKNINDLDDNSRSTISDEYTNNSMDDEGSPSSSLIQLRDKNDNTNMNILNKLITMVKLEKEQYDTYSYIIQNTIANNPNFKELKGFKYTDLLLPLQSLNITYPVDVGFGGSPPPNSLVGTNGLLQIVNYVDHSKFKITYAYNSKHTGFFKPGTVDSPSILKQYSSKIHEICCHIQKSIGIVLIYSNFIDGGLVPMAMALEEMGIHRHNGTNLFSNVNTAKKGSYVMITGEPVISPNNLEDVNNATNINNLYGEQIKVILITKAGSEGIDLKYIRQVHIMDPWYNMNRIEQIIGRAVRNYSHKDLPFEQRNVQIFLYGSLCPHPDTNIESLDVYMYRKAEKKAIHIGEVTRLLKQGAVDCILNYEQQQFTYKNLNDNYHLGEIVQTFSDGVTILNLKIGDLPFSANCDYMSVCEYQCIPMEKISKKQNEIMNEYVIKMNTDNVQTSIKELFKQSYTYTYEELYTELNSKKNYNNYQIYYALTQIINSKQTIIDMMNRPGTLVNIGRFYLFQPVEINDENINIYDRIRPIPNKRHKLHININEQTDEVNEMKTIQNIKKHTKLINITKSTLTKHMTVIEKAFKGSNQIKIDKHDEYASYKYMGISINVISEIFNDMGMEDLYRLVIHTYIDQMNYDEKLQLLEYVLSNQIRNDIAMNNNKLYYLPYIVAYFQNELIIKYNGIKFIIMYKIQNDVLKFSPIVISTIEGEGGGEPEDILEVVPSFDDMNHIEEYMNNMCSNFKNSKNKYLGFMDYDVKKKSYYFKIKDNGGKRNTGRLCYQKIKKEVIINFKEIIPSNIVDILTSQKTFTKPKEYLCILLMLLMRKLQLYYGPEYYKCIN